MGCLSLGIKDYKKFLASSVSAALVASALTGVADASQLKQGSFSDVKAKSFGYEAITGLVKDGVISGYSDGTFRPNLNLTREQAAKLLALGLKLEVKNHTKKYKDLTKNSPWKSYIDAVSSNDVFSGNTDGTFGLGESLTREQMATVLVRAFSLKDTNQPMKSFNDEKLISPTHLKNVNILAQNGITLGQNDGTYGPKAPVNRAQFAVFLSRALNQDKTHTYNNEEIAQYDRQTVNIAGKSFTYKSELAPLFTEKNKAALTHAKLSFKTIDNEIISIEKIDLLQSGEQFDQKEFDRNVVLDAAGVEITGDIHISNDFITLKNAIIDGDLTIEDRVQHDFYASNVTVKGLTTINGGDRNTVVFDQATLQNVDVNKKDVHIELTGKTRSKSISINQNVTLSASDDSEINEVQVGANVTALTLEASPTTLKLNNTGKIELAGLKNVAHLILPSGKKLEDLVQNARSLSGVFGDINGEVVVAPVSICRWKYDSSTGS